MALLVGGKTGMSLYGTWSSNVDDCMISRLSDTMKYEIADPPVILA